MTEAEIQEAYLDPTQPGSFSGIRTFLSHNPQFKDVKFVKQVLEDLRTYTKHRGKRRDKRQSRKLQVSFLNEISVIDTLDLLSLKYQNSHFGYILVLVNAFSRKLFLFPLKKKDAASVAKALDEHFSDPANFTHRIFSDRDTSYLSKTVTRVLDKYGISIYHTNSKKKAFLAEIYVRYVKSKIFRIITHTGKKNWTSHLASIANSLNSNINKSTGFRPMDVNESNSDTVFHNLYDKAITSTVAKPQFKVGDHVRLATELTVFTKRYLPTFSDEIFKIHEVQKTKPVTYKLIDLNGKKIKGSIYGFELTPVSSETPQDV